MLYRILKRLFYLTVKGYFRSIYINGRSNIPDKGPIIFVANHNSAFMDPILIAVHIKQSIYFLARGESFKSRIFSRIFSLLKMIPIYRPEISPDKVHKNPMVFDRCYKHLHEGKSILIFPEGISKTVKVLRHLKTGAARIALGAEVQKNFILNSRIIPIGINYSNPHYFRSDVFINFGKPIEISDYKDDYLRNEKETVIKLTGDIESRLKNLLVIVKDEKVNKLIKQIKILYRSKLSDETRSEEKVLYDYYYSKEIVKVVEFYQKIHPEKVVAFEVKIDNYLKKLEQLNLRDSQIRNSKVHLKIVNSFFYFIFGAPIFIYGYLVNILPYSIALLLSRKINVRKDFIGSMKLALGMFVFLIFYIIQILILGSITSWYWTILFALSMYPAGLFTINYIKNYYLTKGNFRYINLFKKRGDLIKKLKLTRDELISELEEGHNLYLQNSDPQKEIK